VTARADAWDIEKSLSRPQVLLDPMVMYRYPSPLSATTTPLFAYARRLISSQLDTRYKSEELNINH